MYRIKYIVLVIVAIIVVTCKVAEVPAAYKFKPGEIRGNPYGSWTEVSFLVPGLTFPSVVSGELLALNQDTMFLLSADGKVQFVNVSTIATAELCTHKLQTGRYLFFTLLFSIPSVIGMTSYSEYVLDFFSLGAYVYINGVIMLVKEGSFKHNFLIYPKKHSLLYFNAFSRYPSGMPVNIDYNELTLKRDLY
jgi:hypothetical protein